MILILYIWINFPIQYSILISIKSKPIGAKQKSKEIDKTRNEPLRQGHVTTPKPHPLPRIYKNHS